MFHPQRCYSFDLETDNSQGHGLDPAKSRITDISLGTCAGDTVFSDTDEVAMLADFDDAVYALPAGVIFTWNGTHFDLPFLSVRLAHHGILHHSMVSDPTPEYPPKYGLLPGAASGLTAQFLAYTGGSHVHLDIAYAYKRIAEEMDVRWGLKPVAEALGIPVIELDRTRLHTYSEKERTDYAASDARITRLLGMRLLGVDIALAMGQSAIQAA
jgi:DNA polymerase elongation subunit (family B)